MRCPTLTELPPPSEKRTGWPWTVASEQLPAAMSDGKAWPLISIITPNFNYGQFIEETIRSILLQGYPNLEYIIVDGGSTDSSADLIQRYSEFLAYWVSEPDDGQAHAINKGFSRATGSLINWVNSDDLLLPDALGRLARAHLRQPEAILLGDVEMFSDSNRPPEIFHQSNVTFRNVVGHTDEGCAWHQPGIFVPRPLSISVGPLDEGLNYSFDLDYLCRLLQRAETKYLRLPIVKFRVHDLAKTTIESPAWLQESFLVAQQYWDRIPDLNKRYLHALQGVYLASVYLWFDEHSMGKFYDRARGMRCLLSTWLGHPRIAFNPWFLKLLLRAILPVSFFRVLLGRKQYLMRESKAGADR